MLPERNTLKNASSKDRKANSEVFKMTIFSINPKVIPPNELFYFYSLKGGSPSSVIGCHIPSFK